MCALFVCCLVSVPAQLTVWKDSSLKMICYVLLNSTHSPHRTLLPLLRRIAVIYPVTERLSDVTVNV